MRELKNLGGLSNCLRASPFNNSKPGFPLQVLAVRFAATCGLSTSIPGPKKLFGITEQFEKYKLKTGSFTMLNHSMFEKREITK